MEQSKIRIQKQYLKKPTLVFGFGFLFLSIPAAYFLVTRFMSYSLTNSDYLWMGFMALSGVALLKPHKMTWLTAVGMLLFVLVLDGVKLYSINPTSEASALERLQILSSFLVVIGVMVVLLYYRYPYVDRRTRWFEKVNRYAVDLFGELQDDFGNMAGIHGRVKSISSTGFLMDIPKVSVDWDEEKEMRILIPEINRQFFLCRVVRAEEKSNDVLTVRFTFDLDETQENSVLSWLKQNDPQAAQNG